MSDNMQPQQQAMARPNWRQRNVPPQHLAAPQQHLPPQAVPRQLPARPPLHASVTSPNLLSVIPQQQQQQHQPPQQPQQQNNINSNSSSLSRGEVGTVPMQWSGKQAAGTQSAVQPTIGPRPLATDWHGSETVQPRLVRSKSVYGGGDTIRLLRQNQELQERIAKSEQSFEDERRNHVLAIRSLEGSLQDQRSHLQEERKVSGALNRELVQLRAELLAKKKIYEQHSLTMSVSQREQLAKELKELRTRLTEVQRCISPFKSMAGSLGRSPSGKCSKWFLLLLCLRSFDVFSLLWCGALRWSSRNSCEPRDIILKFQLRHDVVGPVVAFCHFCKCLSMSFGVRPVFRRL